MFVQTSHFISILIVFTKAENFFVFSLSFNDEKKSPCEHTTDPYLDIRPCMHVFVVDLFLTLGSFR